MANKDAPFGFRPVRTLGGTPYNSAMANKYYVAAGDSTAIFVGDLVALPAEPLTKATAIGETMNGGAAGTMQSVEQAAAGSGADLVGIVVGIEPNRDDLTKQYRVASTERVIYVCDYPDMIYHIQESGNISTTASALNADITVGTGSTISGKSAMELDSDTEETTATLPLRILQGADLPDNDVTAANAIWEVMINSTRHFYRNATGLGS